MALNKTRVVPPDPPDPPATLATLGVDRPAGAVQSPKRGG